MKEDFVMVFSTVADADKAAKIAKAAVAEGLAACCSIIPGLRSIYKWKGKLCDEPEALCVFKTRAPLFERLRDRIRELHPYEVPEVVCVGITGGLGEYLDWIRANTLGEDGG